MTAQDHHSLTLPAPFLAVLKDHQTARGLDEALTTQVAEGSQHALVAPPGFLASYYGTDRGHGLGEAAPTVPTHDRHALVAMPFVASQYNRRTGGAVHAVDGALPTIPSMAVHYLAQPGPVPDIDDCGFRMLEPHEVRKAMAFPDDYVVLGNKRERVRQLGNAVTPPAMSLLIERCLATLG